MAALPPGFAATTTAFLIWGLFPVYWKWLDHVPSLQVMAHRLAWCCVLVAAYQFVRRGRGWWRPVVANPRVMRLLVLSAALISGNWWLYIWGVNNGHIVETSLGYFINPLVNVLLGVVVLGERLNRAQWVAVAFAAAGVAWLTLRLGAPPWIALGLAFSFSAYGLIRKVAEVDAVPGLGVESAILFLPVAGWLLWTGLDGGGAFGRVDLATDLLLVGGGLVTAVPLALFAAGARQMPYSLVGILQYLAPTLQLACGVLLFDEAWPPVQQVGFALIWFGLAIYAVDGLARRRRRLPPVT